jgi:Xaa-Pro aminopeptidase
MNDQTEIVTRIQKALRESDIPAWLFYDFRESDPIAYRILGLALGTHPTRRWFYLVPAEGNPIKLVHYIESDRLGALPGETKTYLRWQELHSSLTEILGGYSLVAMQYSPDNAIPYVSYVDGGTVEQVRSCGLQVVTSADLIQSLEAVCDSSQLSQHRTAARAITKIVKKAFAETATRITQDGQTNEFAIQQYILQCFEENRLKTDFPPIVAVNENSSNPHYCPQEDQSRVIEKGDFLLIDLWAKVPDQASVFADITWTAVFTENVPKEIRRTFDTVQRARDRGVEFLRERVAADEPVLGFEVDDAVRSVIQQENLGDYFTHRTGHNLGREVHGSGVNFDNLETQDTRQVIPGLLCTIEPGIYLPEFGVRSEINIHIEQEGLEITTPPQNAILNFQCD